MPWAKLDDNLHANEKMACVSLAATGLWTLALSWTAQQLKDGFVPTAILRRFAGNDIIALSAELVAAGLWEEVNGGYQFHDYLAYNPAAEQVVDNQEHIAEVRRAAGRIGGRRSGEVRANHQSSKRETSAKQTRSKIEANAKQKRSPEPEPEPEPLVLPNGSTNAREEAPAPPDASPQGKYFNPKLPLPVEVENFIGCQERSQEWRDALVLELTGRTITGSLPSYAMEILRRWKRNGGPPGPDPAPQAPTGRSVALRPASRSKAEEISDINRRAAEAATRFGLTTPGGIQ